VQSAWISSSISSGFDTVLATSSRTIDPQRLRRRWIRLLAAPRLTPSAFAASSYEGKQAPLVLRKPFSVSNTDALPWVAYSSASRVIAVPNKVNAHRASKIFSAVKSSAGSNR